jgi:hypothetical protein
MGWTIWKLQQPYYNLQKMKLSQKGADRYGENTFPGYPKTVEFLDFVSKQMASISFGYYCNFCCIRQRFTAGDAETDCK